MHESDHVVASPASLWTVPLLDRQALPLYKPGMPLDPSLLDVIACPKCKGRLQLKPDGSVLLCSSCRLTYAVVDEIPNLIIDEARPTAE